MLEPLWTDYFLVIVAVTLSGYLWGIVRTAIWVLPTLFIADLLPMTAVSLLSFWTGLIFLIPYQQGAFNWTALPREKRIVSFFISGVLTGTFFYPTSLAIFGFGALLPLLCLLLFQVFRFPASQIVFAPKQLRWIVPALWLITFAAKRFQELSL